MFDDLLQQLNENCTCLSDDDVEADDFKKNVEQLINLLSILTCWKQNHVKRSSCRNGKRYLQLVNYNNADVVIII